MKALSIRQPWAWLILHGGKDIENRTWRTNYRGRVLIHASLGMTRAEYAAGVDALLASGNGHEIEIPPFGLLVRGGIVGTAEIVNCVRESGSLWFTGPWGWVIRNPRPLPFLPAKGSLGYFIPKVKP